MARLEEGTRFAGFRIESVLGAGGMGVVYRATHLALDRTVALKLITPEFAADEDFRERFKRESRMAAAIDHPNVVTVYEAGEEDDQLYIAMRHVDGTDLQALIRAEGGLEPPRAADLLSQVAAALDAAHARGLVHRDVKPANVLIESGDHAYLTDFGLTKRSASVGPTKTGQWVGTADYVSPEQIQGDPVDARADVYALGCVLYHTLTGKPPFIRDSEVAKIWAHMNDAPPSVIESMADSPPAFDHVIRRAMAKTPGDRYPSAGDLGRAATAALEGRVTMEPERSIAAGAAAPAQSTVGTAKGTAAPHAEPPAAPAPQPEAQAPAAPGAPSPPSSTSTPPSGPPRRRGLLALIAGLVLLVAVGVAASGVLSGGDEAEPPAEETSAGAGSKPSRDAVESLVQSFADIYGSKDPEGLSRILAPDFMLTQDSDTRDREDTVAEYRRQVRRLDSPSFALEINSVEPKKGEADVAARYVLTSENAAPEGGTIGFHVVKVDETLLIDRITIDPS